MNPWLVWSEAVRLPTYPVGLMVGLALGAFVARREALRRGLEPAPVLDVATVGLIAGLFGARLGHLALQAPKVWADPWLLVAWDGGLVFYAGFAAAAGLGLTFGRRRGLDPRVVADIFAPAIALGLVWGRLGCLGSGCCHGRSAAWPLGVDVPWAITYTWRGQLADAALAVPLHPTPIYEALLGLGLFIGLSWAPAARPGQKMAWFVLVYGVGRSTIEVFRGDTARGLWLGGWLSTSQLVGLVSAVLAAAWLARRDKPPRAPRPVHAVRQ